MKNIFKSILLTLSLSSVVLAQPGPGPLILVGEQDGSPDDVAAYKLKVSNSSLTDNGDGTVSIATGTTTPGGSDTQIQYNDGGAFGGIANMVYDDTRVELADDFELGFGTDADWKAEYLEGTTDVLGFHTAKTSSSDADNAMFTVAVDTGGTIGTSATSQQFFEIGYGGVDDSDPNFRRVFSVGQKAFVMGAGSLGGSGDVQLVFSTGAPAGSPSFRFLENGTTSFTQSFAGDSSTRIGVDYITEGHSGGTSGATTGIRSNVTAGKTHTASATSRSINGHFTANNASGGTNHRIYGVHGTGTRQTAGGTTAFFAGIYGNDMSITAGTVTENYAGAFAGDVLMDEDGADIFYEGTSAHQLLVNRHTTSDTAGNNLTVQAGGATSGATDKNGGDLVLTSGIATGDGESKIQFSLTPSGSGSGTTTRNPSVFAQIDEGHLEFIDTAPAVSSCGTSPSITSDATDHNGKVTIGTGGGITSCTVTFSVPAFTNAPSCFCTDESTAVLCRAVSTTTTVTLNATFTDSDVVSYGCLASE